MGTVLDLLLVRIFMQTYHISTTVPKDGILRLPKLPLREGQEVDVTIEPKNAMAQVHRSFPLRGLPHQYIDPFEPAAPPEDWEALNDDPA